MENRGPKEKKVNEVLGGNRVHKVIKVSKARKVTREIKATEV